MNNFQKQQIRELEILNTLDRFGFASARSIAEFSFCDLSYGSAIVCAQRTLKRLLKAGDILRRTCETGQYVYVLTTCGAVKATERKKSGASKNGIDLAARQGYRQEKIINKMAELKSNGFQTIGEIAISRYAPEFRGMHGIAFKGAEIVAVWWCVNSRSDKVEYLDKWLRSHPQVSKILYITNGANKVDLQIKRQLSKIQKLRDSRKPIDL